MKLFNVTTLPLARPAIGRSATPDFAAEKNI